MLLQILHDGRKISEILARALTWSTSIENKVELNQRYYQFIKGDLVRLGCIVKAAGAVLVGFFRFLETPCYLLSYRVA